MQMITLGELKAKLKGNGLVTEGQGIFFSDHILLAAGASGRFVVRAVSSDSVSAERIATRLKALLHDVSNVEIETGTNGLRNAS